MMNLSFYGSPSPYYHLETSDGNFTVRATNYNSTTITSTVTIRVTPRDDYLVSWGFLWGSLFLASVVAVWQVVREIRILKAREATADVEHGGTEAVSTADRTRCTFRRLLLLAMVSRLISMPIMIVSQPTWVDFVGDTLPEMVFATAWTVMVTFFVQLVGSATGTVTNTDASVVIQGTAYVVYTCLIVLELFNSVASVLLYALLCCIYAALLGAIAYFCPKLWTLLQPSLIRQRALVIRLYICTLVCLFVFLGHMVGFARIVIAPPRKVYWWINYGLLELLPSIIFLIIMNPTASTTNGNRSESNSPDLPDGSGGGNTNTAATSGGGGGGVGDSTELSKNNSRTPPGGGGNATAAIKRVDSVGSTASAQNNNNNNNNKHRRSKSGAVSTTSSAGGSGVESASLLMKASPSYGSTSDNN